MEGIAAGVGGEHGQVFAEAVAAAEVDLHGAPPVGRVAQDDVGELELPRGLLLPAEQLTQAVVLVVCLLRLREAEAKFLIFTFPIDVTLESNEQPPSSIRVRALSGTLRHLDGGYLVEPDPNGPKLVLHWVGTLAPDVSLPPLIGEVLMRRSIEDQFTGMVREIERRESVRRAREKDSPKK